MTLTASFDTTSPLRYFLPSCFFQAADAPVRITDFKIVRESSLSRAYCASGNPCFAAWVSQDFALWLSGISRRPSR